LIFGLLVGFAGPLAAQSKKGKPADQASGWGDYWKHDDSPPSEYTKLRRDFDSAISHGLYSKALMAADKMVAGYGSYPSAYLYRAVAKRGLRQYDASRADLEKGIALAKKEQLPQALSFGLEQLAVVSLLQGRPAEAQSYFHQAERQSPNEFSLYNDYAWILATSASSAIRNGPEAVRLATKACELTRWTHASCVDTLAAACAEAGDFSSAVKWQTQAMALEKNGKSTLSNASLRLALYHKKQAYHAP
jgi:Flp pilus assembly protein TadD